MIDKTKPIPLRVERLRWPETARITAAPDDIADLLARCGVSGQTTISVDYGPDGQRVGTALAVIHPDGGIDWTTALRELDPPVTVDSLLAPSPLEAVLVRLIDAYDVTVAKYGVAGSSAAREQLADTVDEARKLAAGEGT